MRITWKDAVTTLAMGGAVTLEYAYFHNWDWPLISNMRWTIAGLAVLAAVTLILGFAFDEHSTEGWDLLGTVFGLGIAGLATLGIIYVISDYVVLLMLSAVLVWIVSVVHHFAEHGSPQGLARI